MCCLSGRCGPLQESNAAVVPDLTALLLRTPQSATMTSWDVSPLLLPGQCINWSQHNDLGLPIFAGSTSQQRAQHVRESSGPITECQEEHHEGPCTPELTASLSCLYNCIPLHYLYERRCLCQSMGRLQAAHLIRAAQSFKEPRKPLTWPNTTCFMSSHGVFASVRKYLRAADFVKRSKRSHNLRKC